MTMNDRLYYLPLFPLWLLPTLINELEAVAIGIEHIGSVIAWIVIGPDSGGAIVGSSRSDCGGVCGVDLVPAVGYKTNMRGMAARCAFAQPQKKTAICAEPFKIGVARWTILAVIVKPLIDSKRPEYRLVERNGAFHVAHSEENVVQHFCRCRSDDVPSREASIILCRTKY
jgi:hypothetical protein